MPLRSPILLALRPVGFRRAATPRISVREILEARATLTEQSGSTLGRRVRQRSNPSPSATKPGSLAFNRPCGTLRAPSTRLSAPPSPPKPLSSMANRPIRNIAIIAHVDHGKTTLVDCLLRQSGTFAAHEKIAERVMDSNDIEKERGITILAKNCAIEYGGTRINIVDTPGHADFGGEVERVLSMVDTRAAGGRRGRRPDAADALRHAQGAGARPQGHRRREQDRPSGRAPRLGRRPDLRAVRQARRHRRAARLPGDLRLGPRRLGQHRPHAPRARHARAVRSHPAPRAARPKSEPEAPLQFQISTLDYNSYVGRIGIGRIRRGTIKAGQNDPAVERRAKITAPPRSSRCSRSRACRASPVDEAVAGDIVAVTGIEDVHIGYTICDLDKPDALPPISVDEPTLVMNFQVNTSPLAGKEGKFVTSRQIRERLHARAARATSRCASKKPATPTCSASRAAASCISPS